MRYTSHQLVLVAHAFAIAKLQDDVASTSTWLNCWLLVLNGQDKHMMEEVARLVEFAPRIRLHTVRSCPCMSLAKAAAQRNHPN